MTMTLALPTRRRGLAGNSYEWLGLPAIVLHHTTGYLSLVEKYEFAKHRRKQQIVAQLLPDLVRDALRGRISARAQAPDPLDVCGGPLRLVLLRDKRRT